MRLKYELYINDEWMDISDKVLHDSATITETFMSKEGKAVSNTCDFMVTNPNDMVINGKKFPMYLMNTQDVLCRVSDTSHVIEVDISGFGNAGIGHGDGYVLSVIQGGEFRGVQYSTLIYRMYEVGTYYVVLRDNEMIGTIAISEDDVLLYTLAHHYTSGTNTSVRSTKHFNNTIWTDDNTKVLFSGVVRPTQAVTLAPSGFDEIKIQVVDLLYWLKQRALNDFFLADGWTDGMLLTIDYVLSSLFNASGMLSNDRAVFYEHSSTQRVTSLYIKKGDAILNAVNNWLGQYGYVLNVKPNGVVYVSSFGVDVPVATIVNSDIVSAIKLAKKETKYGTVNFTWAEVKSTTTDSMIITQPLTSATTQYVSPSTLALPISTTGTKLLKSIAVIKLSLSVEWSWELANTSSGGAPFRYKYQNPTRDKIFMLEWKPFLVPVSLGYNTYYSKSHKGKKIHYYAPTSWTEYEEHLRNNDRIGDNLETTQTTYVGHAELDDLAYAGIGSPYFNWTFTMSKCEIKEGILYITAGFVTNVTHIDKLTEKGTTEFNVANPVLEIIGQGTFLSLGDNTTASIAIPQGLPNEVKEIKLPNIVEGDDYQELAKKIYEYFTVSISFNSQKKYLPGKIYQLNTDDITIKSLCIKRKTKLLWKDTQLYSYEFIAIENF